MENSKNMENVIIVLPARLKSSRLPGKMLEKVGGVPLIVASAKNAQKTGFPVLVVADDDSIVDACLEHGILVERTPVDCASGTDRIAYIAARLAWRDKVVVNVQGDEPLLEPELISSVAKSLIQSGSDMATAAVSLSGYEQWQDPNCVKVVANDAGKVLYFSRAPVPYDRDGGRRDVPACAYRHLGIYAYTSESLLRWPALPASSLESIEKLEQWRALEAGLSMSLHVARSTQSISVDTLHDLAAARKVLG